MAFAFFRRRQKMVLIIMAALMVTFLIGIKGFQMFFRENPAEDPLGRTRLGKVTVGDRWSAKSDLDLLRGYVGLASFQRLANLVIWPTDLEYLNLLRNGDDLPLAYALLLKEARHSEVVVSEDDLDRFFTEIGLTGQEYRGLISALKSATGKPEKSLRQAVGRWLMVNKAFADARVDSPPSESQLRRVFRDLNEKISLLVVKLKADEFIDKVAEPTPKQIEEHFIAYRDVLAGQLPTRAAFGFGYKQLERVKISYLFISKKAIGQVTGPSDEAVRRYYRRHRTELVKKVPILPSTPATAPAAQGATQPATRPTKFRDEQMTFAEAKQQIIRKLTSSAVRAKMDELAGKAEALLAEFADRGLQTGRNPHEWVRSRMVLPAEKVLARKIAGPLAIENQPLDKAVDILTTAAALNAIRFPWGEQGDSKLAPDVRVTLKAENITLGEALSRLTDQVNWPKIAWVTCVGLEGVLFPLDDGKPGQTLQPISVGRTGLVDHGQLSENPILGGSVTSAGQPLIRIAFSAEPFVRAQAGRRTALIKEGEDGLRMEVVGPVSGRVLWRLIDAIPAHAPSKLTDELRRQVVKDIKIKSAFELAQRRGVEIAQAAEKIGLEEAAKKAALETFTTGEFARKSLISPQQETYFRILYSGGGRAAAVIQSLLARPYALAWSDVSELEMPSRSSQAYFMGRVFSLVPGNVEPPYDQESPAITVIALPSARESLVVQRVDYTPAIVGEYREKGKRGALGILKEIRIWQARDRWFRKDNIEKRVDFVPDS